MKTFLKHDFQTDLKTDVNFWNECEFILVLSSSLKYLIGQKLLFVNFLLNTVKLL